MAAYGRRTHARARTVCGAQLDETLSTLMFGHRAKSIKCLVRENVQKSVKQLEESVHALQAELMRLRSGHQILPGVTAADFYSMKQQVGEAPPPRARARACKTHVIARAGRGREARGRERESQTG